MILEIVPGIEADVTFDWTQDRERGGGVYVGVFRRVSDGARYGIGEWLENVPEGWRSDPAAHLQDVLEYLWGRMQQKGLEDCFQTSRAGVVDGDTQEIASWQS